MKLLRADHTTEHIVAREDHRRFRRLYDSETGDIIWQVMVEESDMCVQLEDLPSAKLENEFQAMQKDHSKFEQS